MSAADGKTRQDPPVAQGDGPGRYTVLLRLEIDGDDLPHAYARAGQAALLVEGFGQASVVSVEPFRVLRVAPEPGRDGRAMNVRDGSRPHLALVPPTPDARAKHLAAVIEDWGRYAEITVPAAAADRPLPRWALLVWTGPDAAKVVLCDDRTLGGSPDLTDPRSLTAWVEAGLARFATPESAINLDTGASYEIRLNAELGVPLVRLGAPPAHGRLSER